MRRRKSSKGAAGLLIGDLIWMLKFCKKCVEKTEWRRILRTSFFGCARCYGKKELLEK